MATKINPAELINRAPMWPGLRIPRPRTGAESLPCLVLLGGPDVDARLALMQALSDRFRVCALGSEPGLSNRFADAGFEYSTYHLNRRTNPFSDLRTLLELVSILRRMKPDIVHAFDTKPNVWGRLAARLAGVPVVIGTLTGKGSLYSSRTLRTRLTRMIYGPLQTVAGHVSDLTIFQNQEDRDYFVAHGMVPAARSRIVLGSGVPTDLFRPGFASEADRTRLKHELGLQDDQIVVTMISRLIRSKGVLEFSAAAESIREVCPEARFLLVGPEDLQSQDRLTSEELSQLRQTVICTGLRRDIALLLSISDIFVLPSNYPEGIPRVLLEAASMGLPLVTTNSPGCREVAIDGSNGFLVEAGDTARFQQRIVQLIRQPALRRMFGLASRERMVKHFDLAIVADQMGLVYGELLLGKRAQHCRMREE